MRVLIRQCYGYHSAKALIGMAVLRCGGAGRHYQAGREPTHENVSRSLLFVSASRGRASAAAWRVDWLAGDGLALPLTDFQ
jgi:hypothetical protein